MREFTEGILKCIGDAQEGVLANTPRDVLTALTGDKLTGLIQRLTRFIGKNYVEVGVYRGGSLLNTAYVNPNIHCYGIDNFSANDPYKINKSSVISSANELGIENYTLIDQDFESGLKQFDKEVGVLFVDGPHDYRSQMMCLAYGANVLGSNGCIVVDDANYAHVRQATADFLYIFPEFKLVFEAYTPAHPSNMTRAQFTIAKEGWWDGVHLIVHDPENAFEGLYPPVPTNERFIRDHIVHIARYGAVAGEAAMLLQTLTRPWKWPKSVLRYARAAWSRTAQIEGRYESCNTESAGLPQRTSRLRAGTAIQ